MVILSKLRVGQYSLYCKETMTIHKTHSTLLCRTEQALHKSYRRKFPLAIFLNVILKLSLSLVEKMMFKFDQSNNLISLT